MQSNSDFIPKFSKLVAPLRELLNSKERFKWTDDYQRTFNKILQEFKKDTLLSYFDIRLPTFIFTDAHKTGLCAILAQGKNIVNAKPVLPLPQDTLIKLNTNMLN